MILTQDDLDDFEKHWRGYDPFSDYGDVPTTFLDWLPNHPQVFMAAGFQEFVGAHGFALYDGLVKCGAIRSLELGGSPVFRQFQGDWIVVSRTGGSKRELWEGYSLERLRRQIDDAIAAEKQIAGHVIPIADDYERLGWLHQRYIREDSFATLPSFGEIYVCAQKYVDNPLVDPVVFVSPKLWTPFNQASEKLLLQKSSVELIQALHAEKKELADLTWRQFEEVVAEVLRARGMEIHLVRESPQGGRDIIARTAAVPGTEVLTIAIEVKHRETVDRPVLETALKQNAHFPALMLVTSGRFTSGVLREASKPENRMRLFLKDGEAFRNMLIAHPLE